MKTRGEIVPVDNVQLFTLNVPARSPRVRFTGIHDPVSVVSINVIGLTWLIEGPYESGFINVGTNIPMFITLVEAGTMKPRVDSLPWPRLSPDWIQGQTAAASGFVAPFNTCNIQPFVLRPGPAVDLAASWLTNPGAAAVRVAFEIQYNRQ